MSGVTPRVERGLRLLIRTVPPGARLPSERELMAMMKASRTTVRNVLIGLQKDGLIRAAHGVGWFRD